MKRAALIICLSLLAIAGLSNAGETITGTVVAVMDGDTVKVLTPEKQQITIRLSEIDAPEKNQPFGKKAKQMLSEMIFGKEVSIAVIGHDRDYRTIGRIYQGSADVNLEMVKAGGAWSFTKYVKDPQIPAAQSAAQAARVGLWSLPDEQHIPPWEWRKQRRH
jgi:endonuclease YncB( thermonuclease family)